ncbi:MAG: enolase [Chloroflexi bacterium]|nr:enolase [Chloroflexota bacterium]
MKIANIEVISFHLPTRSYGTKWGYGRNGEQHDGVQTITKITTDDGQVGYTSGGVHSYFYGANQAEIDALAKPLLLGENPLDREKLWHWMEGNRGFSEALIGNIDSALWDLAGRSSGVPVAKLLGGAREKVRAYASTAPNIGSPDVYAQLARDSRDRGYTAFKVHAYIYADPQTLEPRPGKPATPRADVEVCEAVADAVGDDMVLMFDPWGVYSYNESVYVGRELERLGYYFFEHPMDERRTEPYRRLTAELDIPICGPELTAGFHYSRAEWLIQKASDIGRIDINFGGVTACKKAVDMYESFGVPCEMHVGGFGNAAILGATTVETCEYFERGLLYPADHPLGDYDQTPPYLNSPCDPMDDEGFVHLPQTPGLGYDFNWDYINDNLIA